MKTTALGIVILALPLAWTAGCAEEMVGDGQSSIGADVDGLLAFVNDQDTATFEVLDIDCAIRSDSARQIVKHRDGQDRTPYTADDDLFDTLQELDDVSLVGPWTLDRLAECAVAFGYGTQAWVLDAAEVPAIVRDALAAAGIDGYVEQICDLVVGEAIGCLPRCLSMVSRDAEDWLTEQVSAWVGQSFAGRDEVVQAAAALVAASAEEENACWSYPECQGVNAMIACFESD